MDTTRQQEAQQAFLARGRKSLAKARETGEFYPLDEVLDRMSERLARRLDELQRLHRSQTSKP